MKYCILLFFMFFGIILLAQDKQPVSRKQLDTTRLEKSLKNIPARPQEGAEEITIKNYKIITHDRDTTYLDTTLTIQKEYRYNYLRTDDFELMPFSNVGQPYNRLGANLDRIQLYPRIGATARHFNYEEIEDMKYYNVATPMTDLFFKTTFEQGQLLDALLAVNTSRRFNFSIAFKGFRSLGKYQYSQAESGNFRTTANYITRNGRYQFRAHIAAQDIIGEENGGLSEKELQFESEDPQFSDRSRLDVNFTNARNKVLGKRYYLDHQYALVKPQQDSLGRRSTSLTFGHTFNYETKYYQFQQDAQQDFFGSTILSPIDDKATLKTFTNQVAVNFSNRLLGTLSGYASIYNYDYYFNSILITENQTITNRLQGEEISLGAQYEKAIGNFKLKGNGSYTLAGELTDYFLTANANYKINDKHSIGASLHASSRLPDFNYLLYQSEYENYNWQNDAIFDKEQVSSLQFDLASQVWGDLSIKYSVLNNYNYFASTASSEQIEAGTENAFVRPFQAGNSINVLKVKYAKEFRYRKWALNNTLMYQQVDQSGNILNLPQLVTRNTLYFSDDIFRKAMYIQTGITFKYFTSYNMDAYNPLLAEFYVQNREELGGFPMMDFFINAKVRQTRIYLKAEHFNSSFTGNTFYAAPDYPYRDFVIRFGLVWNFFS
ncbi:putative porin [Poritiphilus sp. M415]|uniref:Porin n=2 Tax=Lentiprolixibacter aurantiacus TaxID=2993939 RepID=A0AAE3MIQ3_9FLAO|nr:putative porin [Lentiprolixibacter aurantiacus]